MKNRAPVRVRRVVFPAAAILIAILTPRFSAHTRSTDVTWLKDIQPIVQARCAGCHAPGGAAQTSLVTYREAQANARAIREEVLEGRMPPWPAARGIGDFSNDRSLTPLEIELLTAWADGNAPMGKGDATPVPAPASPIKPASILTIPIPPGSPLLRTESFVVDTRTTSTAWISGWTFRPGAAAQVDRAVVSIEGGDLLGSWTSGGGVVQFPSGVAQQMAARSRLKVEIHYRKSTSPVMSASAVDLYLGPRPRSALHHRVLECGSNAVTARSAALAVTPFAAAAGESVEIIAREADGSVKPVVVIPEFDPGNQLTYRLRSPLQLSAGSAIQLRSSSGNCRAALEFIGQPARAPERSH